MVVGTSEYGAKHDEEVKPFAIVAQQILNSKLGRIRILVGSDPHVAFWYFMYMRGMRTDSTYIGILALRISNLSLLGKLGTMLCQQIHTFDLL